MDENKFFKFVWRFNALALCLAILFLGVIFLMDVMWPLFKSDNNPTPVVNVADDPEGKEQWRFESSETIRGTDLIILPLVSSNETAVKLKQRKGGVHNFYEDGGRDSPIKNILFLNKETNESYWLFNDVERLIYWVSQFPDRAYDGPSKPAKALFYNLVISDTNNDGILSKDDERVLAVSKVDGSDFKIFLQDYDRVISRVANEDGIFYVYQKDDTVFSMRYDLESFNLISKKELPRIKD